MLKRQLRILLHPVVLTVAGLAALFGLVFFGGRFLRGRQLISLADWQLALVFGAAAALLLLLIVWSRYRVLQRTTRLEREARERGPTDASPVEPDRRAEMRAMQVQFGEGLEALKASRLGKRAQEALPWFVILGPPGSGKTTMLGRSGLNFPYTVKGRHWVLGNSGTRNCDWWFTDQGILLDTSGRYTTEADDRREWLALLGMLRRTRRERPINGAVVTISMADLLGGSEETVVEHAARIRERLAELASRLELVFPIYLVFTKCDLIPGFVETFASMDREERAQVWGCTFTRRRRSKEPVEQIFDEAFSNLYDRLCSHRLSRLAEDRPVATTESVYSFPVEFIAVKDRLAEFVRMLVQQSPYLEGADLRGFYFTSATQDLSASDVDSAEKSAGAVPEEEDRPRAEPGSYFIGNLFNRVVFPDHGLARTSSRAALRRKVLGWTGIVGSVAATLALSVLLIRSYGDNLYLIKRSIGLLDPDTRQLPKAEKPSSRFVPMTATQEDYVDRLRDLFVDLDEKRRSPGAYLLGRSDNLYPAVRSTYVDFVKTILLRPLAMDLQDVVGSPADGDGGNSGSGVQAVEASFRREARADAFQLLRERRLYEMIGNHRRPNAKIMREILADLGRWNERWEKYALLDRLIQGGANGDWAVPLNPLGETEGFDRFALENALGKESMTLEQLLMGADLVGIRKGKIKLWLETPDQLLNAQTELDVLLDMMPGAEDYIRSLRTRLGERLLSEYVERWKDVLEELRPIDARNLEDAIANLERHTRADSVYKRAYLMVRSRLAELSGSLPAGDARAVELRELRSADADATWLTNALEDLRGVRDAVAEFTRQPNDDAQRVLRDMRENQGRRIWGIWDTLNATLNDALLKVDSNAESALRPQIQVALQNLAESVRNALMKEVVTEVTAYWEVHVGREFRELRRLYPFAPIGPDVTDIPDNDFIRILSPGGQYDRFYKEVEQFTLKRPETGEYLLKFTESFKRDHLEVKKLQLAMFSVPDRPLAVNFRVEMENDSDISRTELLFGSQRVRTDTMRPDTLKQKTWTWSRSDKGASVIVRVETEPPRELSRQPEEPEATSWSLFRLIEGSETTVSDEDVVECEWVFEYHPRAGNRQERKAHLLVTAVYDPLHEAKNPFRKGFFRDFEFAEQVFNPYERRENREER